MNFEVIYTPWAQLEAAEAYAWYAQGHIRMGDAFVDELERTSGFLARNPFLYPCVEQEIRRANLDRFPYSLFFVFDDATVSVLSCFHQHRDPRTMSELLDL
ncbi:type II toxin-antitoxin system RelE/ParE family toxin [Variovorax saccharolyticus]|uniref:type II toxin-antitoxin system RelE/ParE family toxin n=1 Tax=Variovorax saccharolyticus TaxID=3053516 RepID=UPI0025787EC6|nr:MULTISPECIES: hypothetical protein [unclassified Variovorax]MDM0017607.1 hypothetical protein [Variovorax sp. J22R187]MDM0028748.1 hypothetical protein [Variovorax sp. J31P216]